MIRFGGTHITVTPTHADRLLYQTPYGPTSYKATTLRTLTTQAQVVCDSSDSLADETKYLDMVFNKNNYSRDFIRRNIYNGPDETRLNNASITAVTKAYIKGISDTIPRIVES